MMERLVDAVRDSLEPAIRDFNEHRLPALEMAWGRTYAEEMQNESQRTVETTKNYSRVINNAIYREIQKRLPEFQEQTCNGSDYVLGDLLIEDKNSFGTSNSWVGNGFAKTEVHLLKKFQINAAGRITGVFAAVVDTSQIAGAWTEKTVNTNRSELKLRNEDLEHIQVILGTLRPGRTYLTPEVDNLAV
jgi:hypothetical protein